jgi:hypothetical protein
MQELASCCDEASAAALQLGMQRNTETAFAQTKMQHQACVPAALLQECLQGLVGDS